VLDISVQRFPENFGSKAIRREGVGRQQSSKESDNNLLVERLGTFLEQALRKPPTDNRFSKELTAVPCDTGTSSNRATVLTFHHAGNNIFVTNYLRFTVTLRVMTEVEAVISKR
jgi:hypothetical protein